MLEIYCVPSFLKHASLPWNFVVTVEVRLVVAVADNVVDALLVCVLVSGAVLMVVVWEVVADDVTLVVAVV